MSHAPLVAFPPERMRDFLSFMGYDTREVRYLEFLKPKDMEIRPIPINIGTVVGFLEGIRTGQERCELGVRIWNSIDAYVQQRQPDYVGVVKTPEQIRELKLDPYEWSGALRTTVVAFADSYSIPKL